MAARAERRIRLVRALAWGTSALCASLVAAVVTLILRKTSHCSERSAVIAFVIEGAFVLLVVGAAWVRKLPRRAGAVALDRFHGLADRLSSALSFGELPPAERTPFMVAAIDDALGVVPARSSPRRAVPMTRPARLAVRSRRSASRSRHRALRGPQARAGHVAKTIDAVDVTADDLDAMREFLREIEQQDADATRRRPRRRSSTSSSRTSRTSASIAPRPSAGCSSSRTSSTRKAARPTRRRSKRPSRRWARS